MITVDTAEYIRDEARQLLKNTQGNNGRVMRRFLGRETQHGKIQQTVISTKGLWPRQINAIVERIEKLNEMNFHSAIVYGPVVLHKDSGDITITYDIPVPIETASVYEMRQIISAIENVCFNAMYFSDKSLNGYVLERAGCPDYVYRGYPCSVVEDPWYVCGQDVRGGGGILEWCTSEADAIERLALMQKHKRFTSLSIELESVYQAQVGEQRKQQAA